MSPKQTSLWLEAFARVTVFCAVLVLACCKEEVRKIQIGKERAYVNSLGDSVDVEYSYYLDSTGNKIKDGVTTEYYKNTEKVFRTSTFSNGTRSGIAKWYYESGAIFRVASVVGEKVNGESISFYENGDTLGKVLFTDGKKNGIGFRWSQGGDTIESLTYSNDSLVKKVLLKPTAAEKRAHAEIDAMGKLLSVSEGYASRLSRLSTACREIKRQPLSRQNQLFRNSIEMYKVAVDEYNNTVNVHHAFMKKNGFEKYHDFIIKYDGIIGLFQGGDISPASIRFPTMCEQ